MLHYYLQVVAFQLFFLFIYDVFLKKDTFFNWNRAYLLITANLSLILPFIKIKSLTAITSERFVVKLPQVIIGADPNASNPIIADYAGINIQPEPMAWWEVIIYTGIFIATIFFIIKLTRIWILVKTNPKKWQNNLLIVKLMKTTSAFSFFNYVFLGERIAPQDRQSILEHEKVHVEQGHTLDLLFFELMRIAFWFNPLVYMYQNRIAVLHEYIADAKAVKFQNKKLYYNQLLGQVFDSKQFSIVNPFFKKSLIKKRIIMLSQAKSKQRNIFKYVLLIPLIIAMLFYVSCEKEYYNEDEIDALNLNQYNYTINNQSGELPEAIKIKQKAFDDFLEANPNYQGWAKVNHDDMSISYSIHPIDENVPDGYEKVVIEDVFGRNISLFQTSDTIEKEIVEVDEIKVLDYEGNVQVPFSVIEEVPTVESCLKHNSSNVEKKKCTSDFIRNHVGTNFNTKIASQNGLTEMQRINVIFKIDTDGKVIDIKSRAPHPALKAEATRVVKTLPQFIPGKHDGKTVITPYSLPILFKVND